MRPCYVVPQGVDKDRSWAGSVKHVIMNTIGIRMIKARDCRDNVPPVVLRIIRMWENALSVSQGLCDVECMERSACELCKVGIADAAQPSLKHVVTCSVCLLSWHPFCASSLNAFVSAQIVRDMRPTVQVGLLPELFIGPATCPLCAALFG
eukprot:7902656-Pyramimonas_sp.AAC.1